MREISWLLVGIAVGLLHGWSVSWSVGSLSAGRSGQAGVWVLIGALLRIVGVAVVLLVAVMQELPRGLLAVAGFLAARTAYVAIAASRMAHPGGSAGKGD
jgi:hypothetical protein